MAIKEQGVYQVIKVGGDGTPEVLYIPMEKGAMLGSPFWSNSVSCWAAKVTLAPAEPGGLRRSFLKVGGAKEHYFVTLSGFSVGHALEFGAKAPSRERSAWVVADVGPTFVVLLKCESGIAAARISEKLMAKDPTELARVAKLITPEAPAQETPVSRRDRVTARVKARWPNPLTPNQFTNTVLDIIRSAGTNVTGADTPMDPMDVLEAVDALTEMHLDVSNRVWGKD